MKKKTLVILATVVAILGVDAGVYFSGVLVMPTKASLAKDVAVPSYDILKT